MKDIPNKTIILNILKQRDISIRELITTYWIQTPQEYIRQLRSEGHNIQSVKKQTQSGKQFIEYHLEVN